MKILKFQKGIGAEEGEYFDLFFSNGTAVRVIGSAAYLYPSANPDDDLDELAWDQMEMEA